MPIKTFKQKIEIRTMAETQFPICSCRLYIIFFASAVRVFFLSLFGLYACSLMLISMRISKSHVSSRMKKTRQTILFVKKRRILRCRKKSTMRALV